MFSVFEMFHNLNYLAFANHNILYKNDIISSQFLELQDHLSQFLKYHENFVNSKYTIQNLHVNDKKHLIRPKQVHWWFRVQNKATQKFKFRAHETLKKDHCGVKFTNHSTAWKVSKYRVISGSHFPVFGVNTEIYQT